MHIYPCNICSCDICPYQEYLSCQWPDFETSLANYFPFTLGNLRQLSNGHLSMQHLSWRHLSISAISQLLLARFWPNFKGRFLGPFWTYPNCHNDICPGNISPCDICPYQEYLSCYWPDFDQTLKVDSWDHLELIPTVMATFVQVNFFLVTFVHIRNISAVTDLILTKLLK